MKELSSRTPDWVVFTLLSVSSDPAHHESLRQAVTATRFSRAVRLYLRRSRGTNRKAAARGDYLRTETFRRHLARPARQLAELPDPPPVVVIATNADEWLWAEVLNHGGYDVVERPLERKEMARVLGSACGIGYIAATA